MKHVVLLLSFVAWICACKNDPTPNKFHDNLLIKIVDLQDRRAGDSLLIYLDHKDPLYRKTAAIAFGSVQDSTLVTHLENLVVHDADRSVRIAAAYALGQTLCSASERILRRAIAEEKNSSVLAELIESYGKVADKWKLSLVFKDSLTANALAWAYYRMAVRGVSDDTLNYRARDLLQSTYRTAQLASAHYFARGAKDFEALQGDLIRCAKFDASSDVRMAAALALRKIKSDSTRIALEHIVKNDTDYRVRINAVRALQEFPLAQTKKILIDALNDPESNVGVTASEAIKNTMTEALWLEFNGIARKIKHWRIQANLYEGALSVSDQKELSEEIISIYNRSTNPYQKASLLSALQSSVMSHGFVAQQLATMREPVVKSAAASALVGINYLRNFDKSLKPAFATIYEKAIAQGDPAVIGIISAALADSTLDYKPVITDFNFLKEARSRLELPKDYESIVPLESAIDYFEGRTSPIRLENEFNHPIDWGLVKKIPRDQKADIKTSKGDITIHLFIEEAPGSVANFVSLALKNYYDGKSFHRVAPNFVIQSGCPRGDGWGSEDYSIRSEFPTHRYTTGSVGMASAGKDTEGTQWFITHSATPHLDGRYSLFATVADGMETVHNIEVGDQILSIDIINFK
jgi:cyclophilin family peptidyl-prolyl cis-trans isomerase/HEAT repeat protein